MLITPLVLLLSLGCVLGTPASSSSFKAQYHPLPSLREQDALERKWVAKRWDHIPHILAKYGYDAWLLSMREYAEDTAFRALVPSTTTFSARRRSLFLFSQTREPLYLVDNTPALWDQLNSTLYELDPARIAINVDDAVAFADGLHAGEGCALLSHLDERYRNRTSACRAIPVEVIAARAGGKSQLDMYRLMMENMWAMIAEGFSEAVIEVGRTTPEDLEWWFRDAMWRLGPGCGTWFHPSVDIRRHPDMPSVERHPQFMEGDMVHVDIGISAMGMNTDTQHLGYILRANETHPPKGLMEGMRAGNRLQDMVRSEMEPGRTGDEVLRAVKARMKAEGLDGDIYSHPIGDYGHSAGAVIGMTNLQKSVPELGSLKVLEGWTSVELAARSYVPEWGRVERFELEEDVFWNNETKTYDWVWGQQTRFHLIRPRKRVSSWLAGQVQWAVRQWLCAAGQII